MVLFSALTVPTDIRHQQEAICAYVNGDCLQSGTLYITESEIRWINGSGFGFTVEYPTVAVHAVSKSSSSFPHDSLYLSLDVSLPGESGDGDDAPISTEIRFVPTDPSSLNPMFQAVAACQRLHPDINGPESDSQFNDDDEADDDDDNPEDDYNAYDDADDDDDDEATEVDRHVGSMPESDQAFHCHSELEGGATEDQAAQGVASLRLNPVPQPVNHSNGAAPEVNGHALMDMEEGSQPMDSTDSNPQPEADQFIDAECDL